MPGSLLASSELRKSSSPCLASKQLTSPGSGAVTSFRLHVMLPGQEAAVVPESICSYGHGRACADCQDTKQVILDLGTSAHVTFHAPRAHPG